MTSTIRMIAFLFVIAVAMGCSSKHEESVPGPQQRDTAAAHLGEAKTETTEAARAVEDYTYAQKGEFIAKMKKELAEIEKELDRLSTKVDSSSGAVKDDAKLKLEEARGKWARAKQQLDQVENATESTWDAAKGTFEKSYGDVKDSLDATRQWLSDKIAP